MNITNYLKPALYALPVVGALAAVTPSQAAGTCGFKKDFIQAFQKKSGESLASQGIGDDGKLYQLYRKGEMKPRGDKSLEKVFGGAWSIVTQDPQGRACFKFGGNYNWEAHEQPIIIGKEDVQTFSCPGNFSPREWLFNLYRATDKQYPVARGRYFGNLVELLVSHDEKDGKLAPNGKTWRITVTSPYEQGGCTSTYKQGTDWQNFKPSLRGKRI